MRKKSHLLLSRYLISQMEEPLPIYKKASFCLGSILPDCLPSFLVKRHSYDLNIQLVIRKMEHLESHDHFGYRHGAACFVNLGQVTHYLADYFTYPHNDIYPGTLMEHCHYERDLKYALRDYIQDLKKNPPSICPLRPFSLEDLEDRIDHLHQEYLAQDIDLDCDCRYISRICMVAFLALLALEEENRSGGHGTAAAA